jgi:acetyl esterase/lipase
MIKRPAILSVAICLITTIAASQIPGDDSAATKAKGPEVKTGGMVYKKDPRRSMTIYYPDQWKPSDKRPALVIFRCNIPAQREHFRESGMVIIKPQLAGVNHGRLPGSSLDEIAKMPRPRNQVEDTKSAIRFIRKNAERLGVDPERIVATGTSGGGDLSLQSYFNKAFEDRQDDQAVSPRPNALLLYCPAFDGINIWYVKTEAIVQMTEVDAPSFLPVLTQFIKNTTDEYAVPLGHRADLIKLAASLGSEKGIADTEIKRFQQILELFNKSDWQLLHPIEDALTMSASRLITDATFPPTLIMFGTRDHLYEHQKAFVDRATMLGKEFDLKIFENAGHSFMMGPPFLEPSTLEAERFLKKLNFVPYNDE